MASGSASSTTQQTLVLTPKTKDSYKPFSLSKKSKQNDTLREALNTLKEIRHNVQDNEFNLFGQQVGVQLNKLTLRKTLELQQEIQNLLSRARLDDLNTLPTLNSITPSTDRSILRSSSDNLNSTPHNLHFYEGSDEDFDANDVHNLLIEKKNNEVCDNNIQKTQNKPEVLTTYFSNWNNESYENYP